MPDRPAHPQRPEHPAPLGPDADLARRLDGVDLLADPVRRRLYEVVVRADEPVGRAEAAARAGVPQHSAKFHLDRLVQGRLLAVEHRRLSGRTGPGAGRPAKVYRRSDRQVDLTLPRRRYELAGRVLTRAVALAAAHGVPVADAVRRTAHDVGRGLVAAEPPVVADELAAVQATLEDAGYEPRRAGADAVELVNCPFHALVEEQPDLVCGLNLALLDGVVEGLGRRGVEARLDPAPGRCCVTVVRSTGP